MLAKYDDSCCIIAVSVDHEGSGIWHVFRTMSSENNRCAGAIIPLIHALKTGQVQEINSAEFYYLHMTKNA